MADEDDEIVLSSTSVGAYWRCRYAWYLGHVLRLPDIGNVRMSIGQAVHAGIETFWRSPLRLQKRAEAAQAALERRWASEVASLPTQEVTDDPDALPDATKMLGVYIKEVVPTFTPTIVEEKFSIRVERVIWTGIIDAADEDLHDTKTTAGKTINGRKPSFDPSRADMQLTGYGLGYESITGQPPRRYLLDVLKRSGKYQQYERKPRMGDFLDLIRLTRDSILRRDFEPTGVLNGACTYCPFTEVCEFFDAT